MFMQILVEIRKWGKFWLIFSTFYQNFTYFTKQKIEIFFKTVDFWAATIVWKENMQGGKSYFYIFAL